MPGARVLFCLPGQLFVPQGPAEDLADGGFGEGLAELDRTRDFVAGEVQAAELDDLVLRGALARFQDDVAGDYSQVSDTGWASGILPRGLPLVAHSVRNDKARCE